ncbi:MAG: ribosomal RNA small subunit methyltransferase A [Candidatus Saccharimonadales bacterium]
MSRSYLHAQHFLRDPRLVSELIGHSNVRKNDLVYDLGAGSGVISSVLANRVKHVVAVEIEPQALKTLRNNLGHVENVTIIEKDILTLTPPSESYKIFANIPFHISSDVVRKFTSATRPPKAIYLIVQKQFARKLVPGDNHFTSELGAEISPYFTARVRKPLRRTDFTPPPAVDTVLLEIKPREKLLMPLDQAIDYRELVARCFSDQVYFTKLKKPFSPELRPSQLTPEQWVMLSISSLQT